MNYEVLFQRYRQGRITEAMLRVYVKKGIITQKQYEQIITGEEK